MKAAKTGIEWPARGPAEAVELNDESHGLRATVVPRASGEIGSVQILWRGQWIELLYRAMQFEPPEENAWRGRAPLLWPAVGRNYVPADIKEVQRLGRDLPSCSYALRDRIFRLPIHGFAYKTPWQLEEYGDSETAAWATCSLKSTERTRRMYPFDFELRVTHALEAGAIRSNYTVTAGDNDEAMFFSIGNHLTVNFPFTGKGRFEDGVIHSPTTELAEMDEKSLLTGRGLPCDLTRGAELSDPALCDTVLHGHCADKAFVELRDLSSFALRVSQREVARPEERRFNEPHVRFVFYGAPEKRYFCPEPWLGGPNSLNSREGVAQLQAGERFEWEMRIQPLRNDMLAQT